MLIVKVVYKKCFYYTWQVCISNNDMSNTTDISKWDDGTE